MFAIAVPSSPKLLFGGCAVGSRYPLTLLASFPIAHRSFGSIFPSDDAFRISKQNIPCGPDYFVANLPRDSSPPAVIAANLSLSGTSLVPPPSALLSSRPCATTASQRAKTPRYLPAGYLYQTLLVTAMANMGILESALRRWHDLRHRSWDFWHSENSYDIWHPQIRLGHEATGIQIHRHPRNPWLGSSLLYGWLSRNCQILSDLYARIAMGFWFAS
ncbi:hypothetical protein BKA70DRAFT_876334 [Coprinopsis sp. MPI-PUGE-AT-0042]|nr:hypothetical protein BKA70DRAFT_876334 [Coprinopsis sp. MPI-PUGE-AT-0042]